MLCALWHLIWKPPVTTCPVTTYLSGNKRRSNCWRQLAAKLAESHSSHVVYFNQLYTWNNGFLHGDQKKKELKRWLFQYIAHKPMVTLNMTSHLSDLWLHRLSCPANYSTAGSADTYANLRRQLTPPTIKNAEAEIFYFTLLSTPDVA